MTSDLHPAYVAGIIDGEGTIGISQGNSCPHGTATYSYMFLYIVVANTSETLVNAFKEQYGGFIITRRGNSRHKTSYQWRIDGGRCKTFLEELLPYLLVKRRQAELGLLFLETLDPKRQAVTPEILEARRLLRDEIRLANRRGPALEDVCS